MKKFIMAIFAFAVAATFATAGVGITWSVSWGAYDHNAANVTDDPSANRLLDSYSAIWQLIYAGADDMANEVSTVAGGLNGDYVTGDDVVWGQREINIGGGAAGDGTTWSAWMTWDTGTPFYEDLTWSTAGFVYQRVFETVTFGSVVSGDYYFQTPLLALNTSHISGGTGQDFYVDPSGTGGFQPDQQIPAAVPEPATMGLLGLGALVMAIRRRRA